MKVFENEKRSNQDMAVVEVLSKIQSPFVNRIQYSLEQNNSLCIFSPYMGGGELLSHLQEEGRFAEDRGRFYLAEIVLAMQYLHDIGLSQLNIRDRNILLNANGHVVLCLSHTRFGTSSNSSTSEYTAPELLLDKESVTNVADFWTLGVLAFEMICGWSPFYAEGKDQTVKNICFGKVRFPRDVFSLEGRNFIKALLNRNPAHRLGSAYGAVELMDHPFFYGMDWSAMVRRDIPPPSRVYPSRLFTPQAEYMTLHEPIKPNAPALDSGIGMSEGMRSTLQSMTFSWDTPSSVEYPSVPSIAGGGFTGLPLSSSNLQPGTSGPSGKSALSLSEEALFDLDIE